MEAMHIPVLGQEVFHYLAPKSKQGVILDSTLGEGGHALIFLTQTKNTSVIGVDADEQILSAAKENLSQFGNRVQFFHAWSQEFLASYPPSLERPDAIVSDLGISAFHYCKSGRGFSFSADEPLGAFLFRQMNPWICGWMLPAAFRQLKFYCIGQRRK